MNTKSTNLKIKIKIIVLELFEKFSDFLRGAEFKENFVFFFKFTEFY